MRDNDYDSAYEVIRLSMTALSMAALAWTLRLFGRIFPFVLPIVVGGFLGMCAGAVASDQTHSPRARHDDPVWNTGAAILLALWFVRRRVARKRSAQRSALAPQ